MKSSAVPRLSMMMFLQFFAWGAWFATLAAALDFAGVGEMKGAAFGCAPIAAIFAPLFLGLVADRLFNSEKVMGVLMLIGGCLLIGAAILGNSTANTNDQIVALKKAQKDNVAETDPTEDGTDDNVAEIDLTEEGTDDNVAEIDPTEDGTDDNVAEIDPTEDGTDDNVAEIDPTEDGTDGKSALPTPEIMRLEASRDKTGGIMVWLILGHLLCYMPTLGLGNTIAFTHTPTQEDFPKIRVWGTIGWIIAGLAVGFLGWSNSLGNIFWLGAACSFLLGVFCFTLPATPPPLKGKPLDVRSVFMVDAFKLLADRNFLIFAVCSTLVCVPLAYYYGAASTFLNQTGFEQHAATLTIGQMSEIFFMLLIPFFFRRLGLKVMIMVGMACWVVRYALFAYGASSLSTTALLLAVALHGICYDFFFVTGFMYTDQKAPKSIRGQAQGLLVFLTQGVGMYFGYRIMAAGDAWGILPAVGIKEYGVPVEATDYVENLKEVRDKGDVPFGESLTRMVSRNIPEVDEKTLMENPVASGEIPKSIDKDLLNDAMAQWHDFWILPSIMAAVVLVVFGLTFWDRAKTPEEVAAAESDDADASSS